MVQKISHYLGNYFNKIPVRLKYIIIIDKQGNFSKKIL